MKGKGVRACWSSSGYFIENSYSNGANTKERFRRTYLKNCIPLPSGFDVALRSSVVGNVKLIVQPVAQDMNYLYMSNIFFRNCKGVGRQLITGKVRTISSFYLLLT